MRPQNPGYQVQQNPGCTMNPDKFLEQLLKGENPEYPFNEELDLVLPIDNVSITNFDIQRMDHTPQSLVDLVVPHFSNGKNTQVRQADVINLDAITGAGQVDLSTVPVEAIGYALHYQIAPNTGVLSRLSVQEDLPDNSNFVNDAAGRDRVTLNYEISCLNTYQGAQIARLFNSQIRTLGTGDQAACLGASGRVAELGFPRQDDITPTATIDLLGAPGGVVTIQLYDKDQKSIRSIQRNRQQILAATTYEAFAEYMAKDLRMVENKIKGNGKRGRNGRGNGKGNGR